MADGDEIDVYSTNDSRKVRTMMYWNGSWAWAGLFMIPMMLAMWAAIALIVLPWMRTGRDRTGSPVDRLDDRLAAGDINVEEYRSRRDELERRSRV